MVMQNAQNTATPTQVIDTPIPDGEPTPELLPTPSPEPRATPGENEEIAFKQEDAIQVEYYDIVNDKTIIKEYKTDGENGAQAAIDAINEIVLKDLLGGGEIVPNSIIFSGGNLFIDFPSEIYDLNLGSAGEDVLLNAIADTYLNNVEGIKGVFYTVDGEAYQSDHIEVLKDVAFKTK